MKNYAFYVSNTKSLYFKRPCSQGDYEEATNEMRKNPFSNYWYGIFEANTFEEAKKMAMSSMVSQGCPEYTKEDELRDIKNSLYYSSLSVKDFKKGEQKNIKHYVIINDWSKDYESGVTILGVKHTLEEALEIFNKNLKNEKNYAEEHGFMIYNDTITDFDAGEDGYYSKNHSRLYIQEVEE